MTDHTNSVSTSFENYRAPILWVNGDKGGLGKSFVARVIAAWMLLNGHTVIGVDADSRNAHLDRFYANTMAVIRLSLRREEGWHKLFELWESSAPASSVLIDLPAGIGDTIEREMPRFQEVAAVLNRPLIHVWVADDRADSIKLLARVRDLASPAKTLVVLNGRFADPARFTLWKQSQLRADLLESGASETFMHLLSAGLGDRIDETRSGFHDVTSAFVRLHQRVDFNLWWNRAAAALDPLSKML